MNGNIYSNYLKRCFDILCSLIMLVVFSPLMIILYLIVRAEDPSGSFLFKQKRAGKNGKVFKVIKIRTMKQITYENGTKLSDKDRLLKSGNIIRKLSLDEIPQVINILRGDMSFIGPRPLPVRYLPYYTDKESKRHDVFPGISGLAQVKGRNLSPWKERFEWDVYYVKNISFLLDLKILLLTILKVIKKEKVVLKDDNPLQDLDIERRDII